MIIDRSSEISLGGLIDKLIDDVVCSAIGLSQYHDNHDNDNEDNTQHMSLSAAVQFDSAELEVVSTRY